MIVRFLCITFFSLLGYISKSQTIRPSIKVQSEKRDETYLFDIQIKNITNKPILIHEDAPFQYWDCHCSPNSIFVTLRFGDHTYSIYPVGRTPPAGAWVVKEIPIGGEFTFHFETAPWMNFLPNSPGKYRISFMITYVIDGLEGEIESEETEIVISG